MKIGHKSHISGSKRGNSWVNKDKSFKRLKKLFPKVKII